MAIPLDFEAELLLFSSPEEGEQLRDRTLSAEEEQALLAELRRKLDAWRATLKPTREQLLQTTHEENRSRVRFREDTPELWAALDADWRRKQKPTAEDVLMAKNHTAQQSKAEQEPPPTKHDEADKTYKKLEAFHDLVGDSETPKTVRGTLLDPETSASELREFHEFPPPLEEWAKEENKRREAEEAAKTRAMGEAFDYALRQAEDRARTQRELEDFTRRAGFRFEGDAEEPPKPPAKKSLWDKFWKLTESNFFWGGGVGVALAAYAFESTAPIFSIFLLFLACLVITISIFRHGFFEGYSRISKRIWETLLSVLVAVMLAVIWVLLSPSNSRSGNQSNSNQSLSLSTPSVAASPSPIPSVPSPTTKPSTMPSPVSPVDYFNGRIAVKEGIAVQLSKLLSDNAYKGALNLETLEFYNPSEVNICWRIGVARRFRCLAPGDGYNFPGGANAAEVYVMAEIDDKPNMKFLDVGLKARQGR